MPCTALYCTGVLHMIQKNQLPLLLGLHFSTLFFFYSGHLPPSKAHKLIVCTSTTTNVNSGPLEVCDKKGDDDDESFNPTSKQTGLQELMRSRKLHEEIIIFCCYYCFSFIIIDFSLDSTLCVFDFAALKWYVYNCFQALIRKTYCIHFDKN